jgi:hypothetical protein
MNSRTVIITLAGGALAAGLATGIWQAQPASAGNTSGCNYAAGNYGGGKGDCPTTTTRYQHQTTTTQPEETTTTQAPETTTTQAPETTTTSSPQPGETTTTTAPQPPPAPPAPPIPPQTPPSGSQSSPGAAEQASQGIEVAPEAQETPAPAPVTG